MNTITLPPFYYRDNFLQLLRRACQLPGALLTQREHQLTACALQLEPESLALLVRLLTRKGNLFRSERMGWPELSSLDRPLEELRAKGWLRCIEPQDNVPEGGSMADGLALYNRDELLVAFGKTLASQAGIPVSRLKGWRRQVLDQACLVALEQGQLSRADLQTASWWWLGSDCDGWLETLLLLYFGNLQQSLTDFVLRDIGLARYETLHLDNGLCPFHDRAQLDAHRRLFHLAPDDDWLKQADQAALELRWQQLQTIIEVVEPQPFLQRRWQRVAVRLARQAERVGAAELALCWYAHCSVHPARERRVRLLASSDPWQALAGCREMVIAGGSEDEYQFVQAFVPRLLRQLHKQPDASRLQAEAVADWFQPSPAPAEINLVLPDDWKSRWPRVEQAVLDLLATPETGFYVENALICSVFGLLYWPVLFAPVEGAFFHPLQYRPDDLYERDFRARRQPWLAVVESELDTGQWIERIQTTLSEKAGMQNPFVYWEFALHAQEAGWFETLVRRIPVAHWRAIFEFIWKDPKAHRAGLPDLMLLTADGGYQLLEVKGPGDQLQPNQKSWLAWFASHDIPAAVLYARPPP